MASYGGQKQLQRRAGLTRNYRTPSLLSVVNGQARKSVTPAAQMTDDQVYGPPEDDEDEISEPPTPRRSQRPVTKSARDSISGSEESQPQDIFPSVAANNDVDSDEEYAAKKARVDITPVWQGNSRAARDQRSKAREFSVSQGSKLGPKRPGSSQNSNTHARGSKRSSPSLTSPSPPSKKSRVRASEVEDDDAKDKKPKSYSKPQISFSRKQNDTKRRLDNMAKRKKEKKAAKEAKKGLHMHRSCLPSQLMLR